MLRAGGLCSGEACSREVSTGKLLHPGQKRLHRQERNILHESTMTLLLRFVL